MFTESNIVEQMILDAVIRLGSTPASMVREDTPHYGGESLGDALCSARWTYASPTDITRQLSDVMVEPWVREALIRLNPETAAQPDRADEVIYNLRACLLSVQADGLVRANENFDADVLEAILADIESGKRAREVEVKLSARLRERLEKIKERHAQGFLTSLEFLEQILGIAKEVVEAEKETDPEEERDRAKEALTELFQEAKNTNTHIIVERIVQKELQRTLLKYKLHIDQDLFDKAYGYIRQY